MNPPPPTPHPFPNTPPPPPPKRAEALFATLLDLTAPEARERALAEGCAGDDALATEVRALLAAHEAAGDFMKDTAPLSPEMQAELARLKPEEAGERIGPYKLLQQIGEGGFGVVWMAEQEQPVRRRVALKIIKLGMDTKEVVARFGQERQALAMMDHPNIAKVFDAGATPTGRPFFVMELVRGIRITDYCDQATLPTADRLQLFIAVCHAVQHAHQKGIIHRDLKPSNILVTLHDGVPVPKVIDFGVAKATQQRLTDLTLFTQFEQMIGTPLYMSPEQAEMSGLDIDTRTDIYALGVLLYELLTGRTPFDPATLMRRGLDEIRRVIREQEPPRPSTALSTMAADAMTAVAQHRHSDGPKLLGLLRGDLDWIVMKAIEKDRKRRYDTANGFAEDIQRHLASEPVVARPPSTAYLLQKLVRRHRAAVAASSAVVLALLAGIAVSSWQAVRATHAERAAEKERTKAVIERNRANTALTDLKKTAPTYYVLAESLLDEGKFDDAFVRIGYAIQLDDTNADYRLFRANLLGASHKLREAADEYRHVLTLRPYDETARMNLTVCEQVLTEDRNGTLSIPGLTCWWKADGNAWDSAGTNHGKLINGNGFKAGKNGQAFLFDGSGVYVTVPNSPAWAFQKRDFTIALWVKFFAGYSARYRSQAFLASDDGGGDLKKWIFWRNRGRLQLTLDTPEHEYVDLGSGKFDPVIDVWYHLVVTRSGGHFAFYVNGSELSSEDWDGDVPKATAPLTIGRAEANFYFNGLIDDIRIYNRSLSLAEIKDFSDTLTPPAATDSSRPAATGTRTLDRP